MRLTYINSKNADDANFLLGVKWSLWDHIVCKAWSPGSFIGIRLSIKEEKSRDLIPAT